MEPKMWIGIETDRAGVAACLMAIAEDLGAEAEALSILPSVPETPDAIAKDLGAEADAGNGRLDESDLDPYLPDLLYVDLLGAPERTLTVVEDLRARLSVDVPMVLAVDCGEATLMNAAAAAGVQEFVKRPLDTTELKLRLANLLRTKRQRDSDAEQSRMQGEVILQRTSELCQSLEFTAGMWQEARHAQFDTIHRLAIAAEARDGHTAAHVRRVGEYCALLGRKLRLTSSEIENLRHGSTMHDVGKMGISDAILLKPSKLTPEEYRIMQSHTLIGGRILAGAESAALRAGEAIALSHHEKWDGTGYPHALAGEAIPLFGRICAIADVFDALTTVRPYKPAYGNNVAMDYLHKLAGIQFDPKLLDLFIGSREDIEHLQDPIMDAGDMEGAALPMQAA